MIKVAVIIGSTRPGRKGEAVGKWVFDVARKRSDAEYELVDVKDFNLLSLNDALDRLAVIDEKQARIIEFRFFAGLSIEDTASVLKISPRTVKREWAMARAWLYREMKG